MQLHDVNKMICLRSIKIYFTIYNDTEAKKLNIKSDIVRIIKILCRIS